MDNGRVYEVQPTADVLFGPKGYVQLVVGRTYRITAQVRQKTAPVNLTGNQFDIVFDGMTSSFASATITGTTSTPTGVDGASLTIKEIDDWKTLGLQIVVTSGNVATWARYHVKVYANAGSTIQIRYLKFEDITESQRSSGFADASATSASYANTRATDADTSAQAASTSATNAATQAGNALTYSNNASTSASNAQGYANTASTQAGVAASSAASAQSVANILIPDRPATRNDFTEAYTTTASPDLSVPLANGTTPSVTNEGLVYQDTVSRCITTRGMLLVGTGRTFQADCRSAIVSGGTGYIRQLSFFAYSASYGYLGYISPVQSTSSTSTTYLAQTNQTTSALILAAYPTAVYVRAWFQVQNGTSPTWQLSQLRLRDVSDVVAAAASASAAATSASNAATSETNAGTSASAASSSATNANTYAGNALTYSNNASTSATNAQGYANTASTQAGVAASSAASAQSVANRLIPDRVANFSDWSNDTTGLPDVVTTLNNPGGLTLTVLSDAARGQVARFTNGTGSSISASVMSKGWLPIGTGQTFKATMSAMQTAGTLNAAVGDFRWRGFDGSGVAIGDIYTSGNVFSSLNSWVDNSFTITSTTVLASMPTAVYLRGYSWITAAAGSAIAIEKIKYWNATSEQAAADSATAAATSASTASTQATNAGNSATAASTSATNAATQAGNALTYSNNASTSATTAQGYANTASTQAGVASSAATTAGNSAAAANLSASMLLPDRYDGVGDYFISNAINGTGVSPASGTSLVSNVTISGYGPGYQFNLVTATPQDASARAVIAATAGKIYKVEAEYQMTASTGSSSVNSNALILLASMDGSYTLLGNPSGGGTTTPYTGAVQTSVAYFSDTAGTTASGATIVAWTAGSVWLRPAVRLRPGTFTTATVQFRRLTVTDVTQSNAAAVSANAAATSASTATTQATNAGTSASAASTSATNANTYAGNALTYSNNASTSATNAQGYANTASTQAGVASTSANLATSSLADTFPQIVSATSFTQSPTSYAPATMAANAMSTDGRTMQIDTSVLAYAGGVWCMSLVGWQPNRKYSLNITVKKISGTDANYIATYWSLFNSSNSNYSNITGTFSLLDGTTQVLNFTFDTSVYGAVGDKIRFGVVVNRTSGGANVPNPARVDITSMYVRDITESSAAAASASAAATSASTATTQATNAGNSASAASTSATNANTYAGNALTYSNNASTSATNAQGYATTASTQAGVAATSASSAQSVANRLIPDRPAIKTDFLLDAAMASAPDTATTLSIGTVVTVTGEGDVLQDTVSRGIVTRGGIAVGTGRTFQIDTRSAIVSGGSGYSRSVYFRMFSSTWADLGAYIPVGGSSTSTSTTFLTQTATATSTQILTAAPTAAYVRAVWLIASGTLPTWQLSQLRFRDVTDTAAAAASATAAATSASNAATSETNAGTSASAASSSATSAATQAGNALTYSNNASTSATNAQGYANTASTQAGVASTSAGVATQTAAALMPSDFQQDGRFWASTFNGAPTSVTTIVADSTYSFPTVSGVKTIQFIGQAASTVYVTSLGVVQPISGRVYKLTTMVRMVTNTTTVTGTMGFAVLNSSYSGVAWAASQNISFVYNTWNTYTLTVTGDTILTNGPFVRPAVYVTNNASTFQVQVIKFEDITDQYNAAASATAAATSASTATTQATNASTSASAASASATAASTSAGNALTYSNNASTSATNANTSANTATTQAGVSSTAAASAIYAASRTFPDRPSVAADFLQNYTGTQDPSTATSLSSGTIVSVSGEGQVREFSSPTFVTSRGAMALVSGRTYKISARVRWIGTPTSPFIRIYWAYYDSSYTYYGAPNGPTDSTGSNSWVTLTDTFTAPSAYMTSNPTIVYARPMVYAQTGTYQVSVLKIEDITESTNAAGSATAAATSASTASTQATNAGTSASAANTSATNANTYAGNALTYSNNASTSAGNALTYSNNASTSATAAASSASAATLTATYLFPSDFNQDGKFWTIGGQGGDPSGLTPLTATSPYSFPTVSGIGKVMQIDYPGTIDNSMIGRITLIPGRRYRFSASFRRTTSAGTSMSWGVYWGYIGSANTITTYIYSVKTASWVTNQWETLSIDLVADTAIAASAIYARPVISGNSAGGTNSIQIAWAKVEDITESYNANASSTAAATSASNASTSATNAGNSATAASASAVSAQSVANGLLPDRPGNRPDFTEAFTTTATPDASVILANGTTTAVANEGTVYQDTAFRTIATRGMLAVGSGKTFQADSRSAIVSGGSGYSRLLGFLAYSASFAYLGSGTFTTSSSTSTTYLAQTVQTTSTAITTAFSTAAYIRAYFQVATGTSPTWQLSQLRLRDVTDVVAAAGSATAAAGSASTASTQAGNASSSASAASTSATNANTYMGNALTYSNNASTSASNALTSANTATTQAGLASTYAGNARQLTGDGYFQNNLDAWTVTAGSGSVVTRSDASGGKVFRSAAGVATSITSLKWFPIDTTKKYRIKARWSASSSTSVVASIGFYGQDASGTVVDHGAYGSFRMAAAQAEGHVLADGWITKDIVVTGEGNDSWVKFPTGTKRVVMVALLNATTAASQYIDLNYLDLVDADSQEAAASSASAASTSATNASASAASATTSMTIAASLAGSAITKNPVFAKYTTTPGLPDDWGLVDNTNGSGATRVTGENGVGYACRLASSAATSAYFAQSTAPTSVQQYATYVIEADVMLNSGTFAGAGVLMQVRNSSTTGIGDYSIVFSTDPDITGTVVGAGATGKIYRFRKTVKVLYAGADYCYLYLMNHYSVFGSIAAVNDITWYRVAIRVASDAEVGGAIANAQVSVLAGAVAELTGRSAAYWNVETNAGSGAGAFISARADSNNPAASPVTFLGDLASVSIVGRNITKTAGTNGAWDRQIYSKESYASGAYCSFCPTDGTSGRFMMGLNTDPTTDANYTSIDYAFDLNAGTYNIYQNGTSQSVTGTYGSTDVFSITYSSTSVTYRKNNTTLLTSTVSSGLTLYLDSSFYTVPTTVENVVFAAAGPSFTSTISMGAREVHVYNDVDGTYRKALSISGGNALFSGGLQANTYIRLGSGAGWPVALAQQDFPVSDGTVVTFGTDLFNVPKLTFAGNNLAPLSTGETYNLYADSLTSTGFTARLKISTPGTPTTYDLTTSTTPGTGPTYQIDKASNPDATSGYYELIFSGSVTMPPSYAGGGGRDIPNYY